MAKSRISGLVCVVLGALVAAWRASRVPARRGRSAAPNASRPPTWTRGTCAAWSAPRAASGARGGGPSPPLVEPDAVPASLCDPKDPGNCVDFCSRLAPECAVPWRTVPSCLLPSEQEFRRELFRRDTADRPEALVQGRVTDEAGRRVEGAKISVWFQGTAIADEVSGKDGSFHLRLRAGPWTLLRARQPRRRSPPRSPSCASTRPATTVAQLPARARERHPRAASSAPRASRSAGATDPRRPQRRTIRSPPARRRAPRTARSRWAGSTPSATSCARRSSAGCPRR